jgi:hypothetical protein
MTEPGPEAKVVRRRERRSWMSGMPLLVIPLLAYVAFAGAGADFSASRFPITLPSAGVWQLTLGDILLAVGLLLLFFEILKATRTGGNSVVDHALSMIVFVVCLILFLIWDRAKGVLRPALAVFRARSRPQQNAPAFWLS